MTTPNPARRLFAELGTRIKLRRCASVGQSTVALGRIWVHGAGEVHLAAGVVLDARAAPIELCAHAGGEIHIGPGVRIEGGASIEAVSRIAIGARARLGSFCKILDNNLHEMRSADREKRPPSRPVVVEERAELGAHAILLPGAWVGAGVVVPAGAVVSRSLGARKSSDTPRPLEETGRPAEAGDRPASGWLATKLRAAVHILRASWYLRACERGRRVRAGGPVHVLNEGAVRIGDRTVFVGGMLPTEIACHAQGSIEIGSRSLFNYAVSLEAWESIRIGSRTLFGSRVRVSDRGEARAGPVVIGDDVWIAHGAIIEAGVTIGSGSVVAAGTVVSCDVPPDNLVIGNPARCMPLSLRSDGTRGAHALRSSEVVG